MIGRFNLYRITIDTENNAELYWTPMAQRLWESLICVKRTMFNAYFDTRDNAEAALAKFKALPNWSSDSYPAHAPHPLIDDVVKLKCAIDTDTDNVYELTTSSEFPNS